MLQYILNSRSKSLMKSCFDNKNLFLIKIYFNQNPRVLESKNDFGKWISENNIKINIS